MALTQMQLIQSLGDAMSWFERELNWGIAPTELKHLCGRIGELYVALITNGQMAMEVNQAGYDVVSADGERVSVKTTAMMSAGGHVSFNVNTLDKVDRVIVLRMNTEEMQIEVLHDSTLKDTLSLLGPERDGKRDLALSKLRKSRISLTKSTCVRQVEYENYSVRELENGTIEVELNRQLVLPAKPVLRELAVKLNVPLLNGNGNALNTRSLGSQVIASIAALKAST